MGKLIRDICVIIKPNIYLPVFLYRELAANLKNIVDTVANKLMRKY